MLYCELWLKPVLFLMTDFIKKFAEEYCFSFLKSLLNGCADVNSKIHA